MAPVRSLASDFDIAHMTPDDVRALDLAGCQELASRIRNFLIQSVSVTGGHLGANLGTVELTIALHRSFNSPHELIIFDTGHQTYTHKILTGRGSEFGSLRQRNGLSGFPSRAESCHDLVENSHASTGAAWALGITLARKSRTIVVLGDGALTGGAAYEALHATGMRNVPVTVVYNDNGRSYAPTVSRLTLGEPEEREPGIPNAVAAFFRALGFNYLGPVDGHNLGELERIFADAAELDGAVVVHAHTQKGYGWQPARLDKVKRLHDVSGDKEVKSPDAHPQMWSTALGELLCELAECNDRVHVITAAMPDTLGLLDFQRRFPDRYHDVGICEQLAVGLAAGLASAGCRPVFPVVSTFLTRALDQVIYDVALHELPVTLVLDRAGVTGRDGPSHHGIYDVGLLRTVPGLTIYSPTTRRQLKALLRSSTERDRSPVVIRYPKDTPLPDTGPATSVPPATKHRQGRELCLLAHGATVGMALNASTILEHDHGVSVSMWEITRIHPVDSAVLADAGQHPAVVVVEDLLAGSGVAASLFAHLAMHPGNRPAIAQVALPGEFLPWGGRAEILAEFGITVEGIVQRAVGVLR